MSLMVNLEKHTQKIILPNPINIYGLSKLNGEKAIIQSDINYLIFRTSWVYSDPMGNNFPNTSLEKL